tara:strand:+ start:1230 stop:3947 length:2718 start_codon:yes stop_codon:yes gene_type:complete
MAVAAFSALTSTLLAGATGVTLFGTTMFGMQAFLAMTATFAVLGAVSRSLFGQPELNTMDGINFNVRDPVSTRKLVYGTARIGGTIVFFNTSDTNNNYLHMVIAVAGHEIESYEEVYFGDEKVWDGGSYLNDWDDHCLLSFHDGSQTTADSTLVSAATGWSADHKLLDTAYIYARLDYDRTKYVSGVPNISCVIKGKKVYDPRTTTTVWSENPALILNDYLKDTKYGLGESASKIDTTALTTAANICDENMPIGGGSNQKKYTCDGVLDTASSIKSNIENILTSMMGSLHWSDGKFYILAQKYVTPVADAIDEDVIVAPIKVSTKRSRSSLYNSVKGKFVSTENNYVVADYPTQSVAQYVTDDGEELALDLTLPMTTENKRAQRIAYLTMKKSRLQMSINMQLNLSGLKYKVGDNVKVVNSRFGWTTGSPKIFEITNLRIVPDPERGILVEIDAVENEDVDDWTGTSAGSFVVPTAPDVYTGTEVVAPTNAKIYAYDKRVRKGIKQVKLVWDGVEEADGATPHEPYFKQYVIEVDSISNKTRNTYYTTSTEQLIKVSDRTRGKNGEATNISIYAENLRGYLSPVLSLSNVKASTLFPDEPIEPTLTFYGTQATPTEAYLTQLVRDHGVQVQNGLEILYVQVDGNNDPISSAEYQFTSENFMVVATTDEYAEEVDVTALPELLTNGTFSDTSAWTNPIASSQWSITGGKLVCGSASGTSFIWQDLQTDTVGNHTASFVVEEITGSFGFQVYENGVKIFEEVFNTTGTKIYEFTSQNRNLKYVFARLGDATATIDTASLKAKLNDAVQEYTLFLPESVTETVTFTHTETDKDGVPATGVSETYTGFSSNLTDAGRKYVKVKLERSTANIGYSQLKTTVTASWTVTGSGIGDTVKQAEVEIALTARVL